MKPSVTESTTSEGQRDLEFRNHEWLLRVRFDEFLDPGRLVNLTDQVAVADERYLYRLGVDAIGGAGTAEEPIACQGVRPLGWSRRDLDGGAELALQGRCDFGPSGPTDIEVEHVFRLYEDDDRIEEQLSLINAGDRVSYPLSDLHFAFRKILYDRQAGRWLDAADEKRLIPVPLRRYVGLLQDHRLDGYTATDLMTAWPSWPARDLPDRSAEAWLWGSDQGGYLTAKYAQHHIEFGVARGAMVPPEVSSGLTTQLPDRPAGQNLCLCFGGAAMSKGEPAAASVLDAAGRVDFGVSVICRYRGDWQAGYGRYKRLLAQRGHGLRPSYTARVHWNELYNLGWWATKADLPQLSQLWEEAARARAAGAEAFYFDPGWDPHMGTAVWDAGRLGPLDDFVAALRDDYGLALALHLSMHTQTMDEDPAIYRRARGGDIDTRPFPRRSRGGYICPASKAWQEQKVERVSVLADAGVSFFMFDFLEYGRLTESADVWWDSASACWSAEHGHSVPLTRREHAEGILHVVHRVKQRYPDVMIEAHDRIIGGANDYLPLYYQHGSVDSYDEGWGFEFMWDPFADLLSGKALSLYEYNLAYEIPLYLHINVAHDLPSMVAFWWYASTCRHLGVGGITAQNPLWESFRTAMRRYMRLKHYFVQGRFVGIDTHAHGHVLDDGSAVLLVYNLTGSHIRRTVTVPADDLGLVAVHSITEADGRLVSGMLTVNVDVPSMTAAIVEINTHE